MKQWYAGRMRQDLLGFKQGEMVYYRRAETKRPLKVGPVFILFRTVNARSIRICESLGIRELLSPWPNGVNPTPAPPSKNEEIEHSYQSYLETHPLAPRHSAAETHRILSARQSTAL